MAYFRTVYIVESEAGWGSKVDEVLYFSTDDKAQDYVEKYNTKYNPPRNRTPDWYMIAQLGGIVEITKERLDKIRIDPTVP